MARRRAKGEGSVTEYRKGHYRAFLDLGKDPATGKRIRKTFTGSSKAEVIAKLNKAKYEKQEGILIITKKTPLALYCTHWLSVKKPNIRGGTYTIYKYLVEDYIRPQLGHLPIDEVSIIDLNNFFSKLDIAQSSKVRLKSVLYNIFKLAVKEQLLVSNVTELLDPIKNPMKEVKAISVEELHKLLATAKAFNPFYYIIKLTVETGMRRGEVLALHWSDIDFDKKTISIKRALQNYGGYQIVGEPKTAKSKRTISVSSETLQELLTLRKEGCEVVFSNPMGTYLYAQTVYRIFKKIVKEAGLRDDIRFHDLRHTNATFLISKGINMKTVSERLGHSSITITMDRYTHGVLEEDQKAAKVIEKLID